MRPHRPLIAFLSALCIVFAGIALYELIGPANSTSNAPRSASPSSPANSSIASNPTTFSLPKLDAFSIVSERPLFSPDRRPPAHATDSAGPWSSFSLAGIIITPSSREALVTHGKPPSVVHVSEGQTIEGWTITAIYPDHVVFTDRLSEHELRFVDKGAPPLQGPASPRPTRY